MPDIDLIWGEIERLRVQVTRERLEILEHHKARLSSLAAKAPLARIDALCAELPDQEKPHRRFERGHYSLD